MMKKYKILALTLCVAVLISGCTENKTTPAVSEVPETSTTVITTVSTAETSETTQRETTADTTAAKSVPGIALDYLPDYASVIFNRREFYLGDIGHEKLYSLLEELEPLDADSISLGYDVDSTGFQISNKINLRGDKSASFCRMLSREGWVITGYGSQLYRESPELTALFAEMIRNLDHDDNRWYYYKDRQEREPALYTDDIYRGQMYGVYRLYGSRELENDAFDAYITGNGQTYPVYVLEEPTDETDVYIGDYFFPDMPDDPGEYVLHVCGMECTFRIRDFSEFDDVLDVSAERTETGAVINVSAKVSGKLWHISIDSGDKEMQLMYEKTDGDNELEAGEALSASVRGYTDEELEDAFGQVKKAIEEGSTDAMYIMSFFGIGYDSTDDEIKDILNSVCRIDPDKEYTIMLSFETDDGKQYLHYKNF